MKREEVSGTRVRCSEVMGEEGSKWRKQQVRRGEGRGGVSGARYM